MKKAILYIHGKHGNGAEADRYKALLPDYDIYGPDYPIATPWDTKDLISEAYEALTARYDSVVIIANSIGAYFTMNALHDRPVEKALFISPVVDMERLTLDLMQWANVTEAQLQARGEIETDFGETLSWPYLQYVRSHPYVWRAPTEILYAEHDHLTAPETVQTFCQASGAGLTVMENGEHWFHTDEQLEFLDSWVLRVLS